MAKIEKVLSTVLYDEEHVKKLKEIFEPAEFIHLRVDDMEGIAEALKSVDVAVLGTDRDERVLNAPNIKWIHYDHAGLNRIARQEVLDKDLIITGSAGRSAPALAEHALYFMLSFTFSFPLFYKAQLEHNYVTDYELRDSLRCLFGRTIGIVGMGNTGRDLAVRAKALGMNVLGYKRHRNEIPAGVDKLYYKDSGDSIDELLKLSDFVVLALPLSNESYHLISERELKLMKSSAYLINIARGAVIEERALINALKNGWIAGAGLDTFEQEPLLADNPLWDAPNTIITPHVTPQVPDRTGRSLEIITENIRRYKEDKPMLNQLCKCDIFGK
ncbi:MAG: D-2-hydroxyacid dehydrogenase [Herbinix sp.]|jgi:phosphoglycerate dehydrogenase-like enzyme|nr:D-2-hydroxyacid dehydrogenase [Herbinix sp.]